MADAGVVEYVSLSCRNCHNLLYDGFSKLKMLLCGDVNFRLINEAEVLILIASWTQLLIRFCTMLDARVVEYVSVSKLETILHSCNLIWGRFAVGRSSVSACPRKLIPVDRGSPYTATQVEEWGFRDWRFRVKKHTVQLTKLPRLHSRGVHRLCGLMTTIATAGPLRLSQITYPVRSSGPTPELPRGFVCVCQYL